MSPRGLLVGIDLRACCGHVSARLKARKHGAHTHSDNNELLASRAGASERFATISRFPLRLFALCPRPSPL